MVKKLLDESKATTIEEDIYLEEPEDIQEISEGQIKSAFTALINNIVKDEFALIEQYNSVIATLEAEDVENKDDILAIVKTILDEKNINVGMLTKALELVDNTSTELMNKGLEKAEEIISDAD